MTDPVVVKSSSWRAGTAPATEVPALAPAPNQEDEYDQLMDQLTEGAAYDIVQLAPDRIGLVVNGELRATYRKESVYRSGSTVAKVQLETAEREAKKARRAFRGFERAVKGSGTVRRDVGEGAADGIDTPVADSGLEKWLGPLTDADPIERALARDRRRGSESGSPDHTNPAPAEFEKVEGVD